ncbi:MAG: TSUP family transporter [Paracoccaceae bacterium]
MPDILASVLVTVLATPGLFWLVGAAVVAGLVRGFSGFGTAMVYLPVAGQYLPPFEALTTLVVMDLIGPLPNVPRALRDGELGDLARLALGMIVAVPAGVFVLTLVAPEVFRYGVSGITISLLLLLLAGVRYRGVLSRAMVYGTGVASGFLAGSVGVPGPPVIMLYMASAHPAKVIRANITLYLILSVSAMLMVFALFDQLVPAAIGLGVFVAVPYLAGNMLGAALFRPEAGRTYRAVAYLIIAASAVSGLPVWD